MDTKILDNDKSNVKDKSNFLKTDDIVVVERYNQLGKKKKIKWWKRLQKKKKKKKKQLDFDLKLKLNKKGYNQLIQWNTLE